MNNLKSTEKQLLQAMRDQAPEAETSSSDIDDDEAGGLGAVGAAVDSGAPLKDGTWVVSKKRNGNSLTLHRVGSCWRIPGKHYARFEVLATAEIDEANPDNPKFNNICQDCFKGSGVSSGESASESEREAGSDSSSSETD